MLRVEMLPADQGDALWLEYGDRSRVRRVLIDGGPWQTYDALRRRILLLAPSDRHFELLIITHLDGDHIEGAIRLLLDRPLQCSFGDIWVNDWQQVASIAADVGLVVVANFGGAKAGFKFFSTLLHKYRMPMNRHWGGGPVVVPIAGHLPCIELAGGLRLTLLSPEPAGLLKLHRYWRDVVNGLGFNGENEQAVLRQLSALRYGAPARQAGPPGTTAARMDRSVANGSSIAVLAEHQRHRVLLSGDALPDALARSLERWKVEQRRTDVILDAFKLPHHGSKGNVNPDLLDLMRCRHYLLSTSGRLYGHPSDAALELVLKHHRGRARPVLHFNYRTAATIRWANAAALQGGFLKCVYPPRDDGEALRLSRVRRP